MKFIKKAMATCLVLGVVSAQIAIADGPAGCEQYINRCSGFKCTGSLCGNIRNAAQNYTLSFEAMLNGKADKQWGNELSRFLQKNQNELQCCFCACAASPNCFVGYKKPEGIVQGSINNLEYINNYLSSVNKTWEDIGNLRKTSDPVWQNVGKHILLLGDNLSILFQGLSCDAPSN